MTRSRFLLGLVLALALDLFPVYADEKPVIEVSGTASISIVPDRITLEIGMEEYYQKQADGDSVVVSLAEIEGRLRQVLAEAKISDSSITLADMGNYSYHSSSQHFLMAKKIHVVLSSFGQLEAISGKMGMAGISSFHIASLDNSDMEEYNRQGLKAALDAARAKAEFIANNENLKILMPYEIVDNGPSYYDAPMPKFKTGNVSFDSYESAAMGGMESMRRIVRRYSVRVRYLIKGK